MHDLTQIPTGNDNNSAHYKVGSIECIDYITDKGMSYVEGNIIKYITRYRHKGGLQDLYKAQWYITRLINDYTLELGLLDPPEFVPEPVEVSYWKRESPGGMGEATRDDEYHQISPEAAKEYIESLNQLHIEPGVPACAECLVPADLCDHNDDDWSEENCRKPFGIDGVQIVKDFAGPIFAKDAICDDPCSAEFCYRCILTPEANVTPYPPGHPYPPSGTCGPCHRCKDDGR